MRSDQRSLGFRVGYCHVQLIGAYIKGLLHEGGVPQVGEVTSGGLPNLTCKRHHIKMRDYMDNGVTHLSGLPDLPGFPHLHINRP